MLALVGSGEYLPPMEPVDRELLGRLKEPARVVCLPTAAGTEGTERIQYWSRLGVQHFTRLGAVVEAVEVIDRKCAFDSGMAATIAGANFVYLSGGKPHYLYQTLQGSPVWEAILSVLANGGVLAGCSAGAMVMGEKFYGFPGIQAGFDFISGVTIIPHFDEAIPDFTNPIQTMISEGLTVLGIEGNTALVASPVMHGSQEDHTQSFEVLGSGGVTVWNKREKTRYTQGDLPDWR